MCGFLSVGNIPYEATEEKLKDIFGEVGQVLSFKWVDFLINHSFISRFIFRLWPITISSFIFSSLRKNWNSQVVVLLHFLFLRLDISYEMFQPVLLYWFASNLLITKHPLGTKRVCKWDKCYEDVIDIQCQKLCEGIFWLSKTSKVLYVL